MKQKIQRKHFLGIILTVGIIVSFVSLNTLSAATYDYYVKEGEDGDGSSSDPFGSIKDAIDAVGDKKGKKIFLDKGSYSTSFALPKETELVGANDKDVSLTGLVTLENKTKISRVTFTGTGGGIVVTKNASVTIEDIRVKNLVGTAIKSEAGSATVKVRDSVIEGARKGMYLQAGTTAEIENVEVMKNLEEGIDLRENVNGFIRKSVFKDNKESGIEIILGSSDFEIRDNTFSGNGASGVAAQFYQGARKVGSVRIEGNSFTKNDWGVDCKAPQGKMDSKFYFLNSLTIQNNTYKDNGDGEIASRCKIMTDEERIAFEVEEKKKAEEAATRTATLSLTETQLQSRFEQAVAKRQAYEDELMGEELGRVNAATAELSTRLETLESFGQEITDRSSFACFLAGPDYAGIKQLESSKEELQGFLTRLRVERTALRFDQHQSEIDAFLAEAETRLALIPNESALNENCTFSLFGWASRFLADRSAPISLFSTERAAFSLFDDAKSSSVLFIGEIGYVPLFRERVVKLGDDAFFGTLSEKLRSYDAVIPVITSPLMSELDPLPPVGATAALSLPLRFAHLFSATNIRAALLGGGNLFQNTAESYKKSRVNLAQAGIDSVGPPEIVAERSFLLSLPQGDLRLLVVAEGDATPDPAILTEIMSAQERGEKVAALIQWNAKRGGTIDESRKSLVTKLVDSGAALVLGTGLTSVPMTSELIGETRFYPTVGSLTNLAALPASSQALSVEFTLDQDGQITFAENPIQYSDEKGLFFVE